jgi:hypothetical protein
MKYYFLKSVISLLVSAAAYVVIYSITSISGKCRKRGRIWARPHLEMCHGNLTLISEFTRLSKSDFE